MRYLVNKAGLAALVLLLSTLTGSAVWHSGTIVVLDFEQDRLLAAADSRESLSGSSIYRDDACKIVPLDDHSFFAATGHTEIERGDGKIVFSATEAAKRVFRRASTHQIRKIASSWGDDVSHAIESLRNVPGFALPPPGEFVTGIFATSVTDSRGVSQIETYEATVSLLLAQAPTPLPRFRVKVNAISAPQETPYMPYGSSEGRQGLKELLEVTSDRAWTANERLKREIVFGRVADPYARILEVSIQFACDVAIHKNEIGGPVDILELRKGGKIKWIKVKSQCH